MSKKAVFAAIAQYLVQAAVYLVEHPEVVQIVKGLEK